MSEVTKRRTRPLGRNVVIEVVLPVTTIIMPDDAQLANFDDKDFVIADVGDQCTRGLKVGDMVQCADGFRGLATADSRERHFICSETDIEGVIELCID